MRPSVGGYSADIVPNFYPALCSLVRSRILSAGYIHLSMYGKVACSRPTHSNAEIAIPNPYRALPYPRSTSAKLGALGLRFR
jgi:hypothetical protein